MTKEKVASLAKYLQDLSNKLTAETPKKHEGHPETYRQHLVREIDTVRKKLEDAKLAGSGK